jgi:DNA (cytosine-5)-methyltransferase 1
MAKRTSKKSSGLNKTFCEFFAGIGLVREGLEPGGWQCVYANEISPKKQQMYEARFGSSDHFHLGDVRETDEVVSRIPGAPFLATASFPCVDLSLAGRYKGFEGERSSTFFCFLDAMRALADRKPAVVMLENVAGFLTSRGGEDFRDAAAGLMGLGYAVDAILLDAKYFTPQSRPRVFVFGVAEELSVHRTEEFSLDPEWTSRSSERLRPAKLTALLESIEGPTGWRPLDFPSPPRRRLTLDAVIEFDECADWWPQEDVDRHYAMMSQAHREEIDRLVRAGQRWIGTIFRRIREGKQRAEVRFDGLAGCLRTPRGGSARQIVAAVDDGRLRMRWMSPREYARLQGAPDFPLVGGTQQQLFGFADAVCSPAIAWIDQSVLTPLFEASLARGSVDGSVVRAG